jgi:hypothetical protein
MTNCLKTRHSRLSVLVCNKRHQIYRLCSEGDPPYVGGLQRVQGPSLRATLESDGNPEPKRE